MFSMSSQYSSGLLQLHSFPYPSSFRSHSRRRHRHGYTHRDFLSLRERKRTALSLYSSFACLRVGFDELSHIAHNKVLIAATVSAAIGQLVKPFASATLYGNSFNFKCAIQAGGFPSTHSSAVVATAASLGFERGFSDAIFGLAVVYAALIMYDAQGVRREVGTHAKVLNRVLLKTTLNRIPCNDDDSFIDSSPGEMSLNFESFDPLFSEEASSFEAKPSNASPLLGSGGMTKQSSQVLISSRLVADVVEGSKHVHGHVPLRESVGHTESEVIAGAFLGFIVSLAVCSINFAL